MVHLHAFILYIVFFIRFFELYCLLCHPIPKENGYGESKFSHATFVKTRINGSSKKYYHHFCDIFFEMIKTMTISDVEINKRFRFTNLEVYGEFERKEKSIIVMCAHYESYEWLTVFEKYATFEFYVIY